MQEYRRKNKDDDGLLKVYLNDGDDFIILNANDATFESKYRNFLVTLEEKSEELESKAKEYGEKYEGKPMISQDEDGNAEIDTEQFGLYVDMKISAYKEICNEIDELFGAGTIEKYFRKFYEINPEFIPDDECIKDFLEEISEPINIVYGIRNERISKKYNAERKGKHTKTKAELIEEATAAGLIAKATDR